MAKLQNKLFAKLTVVEEKGEIILDNLKLCHQHLGVIVSQCRRLLQVSLSDSEQIILGLGEILDHVGDVLVLTIARVGAQASGVQQELDLGAEGDEEKDDIIMAEMKNKLQQLDLSRKTELEVEEQRGEGMGRLSSMF